MSTSSKTLATGRIEVKTYEPQAYEEVGEGPNLIEIHVTETFSGDIEGEGVARFLQAVGSDGSASFVGIERVTGSISGRHGSFLLQDAGTLANTTGTGELSGLRGEGGFTAELGQNASMTLDCWFA